IQRIQVGADYIETHAAPGELGLARSSREAGMKEELQQRALVQILRVLGRNQSSLDGGAAHAVIVDAAAVIFYLYIYMVAAMVGAHRNISHFALAGMVAIVTALQAVGHGIAHQMNERIGDLLNDVVVEFSLGAGEREFNLLVAGLGGIADSARNARIKVADGNHACLRDLILQAVRQLGELVNVR